VYVLQLRIGGSFIPMKSFERKNKNIIDALLSASDYLTLEEISKTVGLSKRSVQNHLEDIDKWIENNVLKRTRILRKQGHGVKINTNVTDRRKIEKLLGGKSMSTYNYDNTRRLDIIKKLIFPEENITVKYLAEQYHVTRQLIAADLEWVEGWLHSYRIDLDVTQRNGVVIQGSEVSRRNAIAGYFYSYGIMENAGEIIRSKHGRFDEKSFQNLIKVYPEDNIEKIKGIIEMAEKKFGFFLNDDYYESLITHIVIGISRLMNGNTVSPEFAPPEDEKFPDYITETADYIMKLLEDVFDVVVPDMEKAYICIHLIGFNALSVEQSAKGEMPTEIVHLTMEIIKDVDSRMKTNFSGDKLLFFELCLHLKSTIFRIQRDVYHKISYDYQLPDVGVAIYNAVEKAGRLYQEICRVEPEEEEILSVTCYFLLSMQRNLRKPKALLIYNGGIIERMKFMDLIAKTVQTIDVTNCCTTYQLNFLTLNDYDCIISKEAIALQDKPVIDLSETDSGNYNKVIMDFLTKVYRTGL
jgi:mannitol operon transcriptional antiterminator